MDKYKQALQEIYLTIRDRDRKTDNDIITYIDQRLKNLMSCSNCGSGVNLDYNYCPYCGKRVDEEC